MHRLKICARGKLIVYSKLQNKNKASIGQCFGKKIAQKTPIHNTIKIRPLLLINNLYKASSYNLPCNLDPNVVYWMAESNFPRKYGTYLAHHQPLRETFGKKIYFNRVFSQLSADLHNFKNIIHRGYFRYFCQFMVM